MTSLTMVAVITFLMGCYLMIQVCIDWRDGTLDAGSIFGFLFYWGIAAYLLLLGSHG